MKSTSVRLALGTGTIALTLTACGALKNMNEMHDSTQQMNSTTSKMAKTTENMSDTTDRMARIISNTYSDLRIGNTRDARQNALEAMEKAEDPATKMGYASQYYAAQEYQFWKPETENAKMRDELMTLAVKDFFKMVRNYVSDRSSVDIKNAGNMNMLAMAATLHYENFVQTDMCDANPKIPHVTMLSMLEDGLRMADKVNNGDVAEEDLPAYQVEVLRYEQDAKYILQARQLFLKAFAYTLSSTDENGDEVGSLTSFRESRKPWAPNFAARNVSQINYVGIVLEYTADTVEFLRSINVAPIADKDTVIKIWFIKIKKGDLIDDLLKNMDVDSTVNKDSKPVRVKRVGRVKAALKRIYLN